MNDGDYDAGLLSNLNSPPFADFCMRDASESSTEAESEDDAERMGDDVDATCVSNKTFSISGSPPKLINTPPSTLAQKHQQPNTLRREIRPSESWRGPPTAADELEDGRHIGGLTCPKGELTRKQLSANEIPPLRTPVLGRSRSLPDFAEAGMLNEWHRKSLKSSGNCSPRSALRDWDGAQEIALMLPNPRDRLHNYLQAHQVADCKAAAEGIDGLDVMEGASGAMDGLHGEGPVPMCNMAAAKAMAQPRCLATRRSTMGDQKRPSTDPGSSRRSDPSGDGSWDLKREQAEDEHALEMANAFKEWVRF